MVSQPRGSTTRAQGKLYRIRSHREDGLRVGVAHDVAATVDLAGFACHAIASMGSSTMRWPGPATPIAETFWHTVAHGTHLKTSPHMRTRRRTGRSRLAPNKASVLCSRVTAYSGSTTRQASPHNTAMQHLKLNIVYAVRVSPQ